MPSVHLFPLKQLISVSLLAVASIAIQGHSATSVDPVPDSLKVDVNTSITAVARQTDGKLLIGGSFGTVNRVGRLFLARLNVDGSLDTSFNPAPSGVVNRIVLQADGKILIGGSFVAVSGFTTARIARINEDGSVDTSFSAQLPGRCFAIAVQPGDSKIVVGGEGYLERLEVNGSSDPSFNRLVPGGGTSTVHDIALQPDTKILASGSFTILGSHQQLNVARITATGNVDSATFDPRVNGTVYTMALHPDGRILIGGDFGTVDTNPRPKLARLDPDGSIDSSFNLQPEIINGSIYDLVLLPSGEIYAAGDAIFIPSSGAVSVNLGKIDASGNVDGTFDPRVQGAVSEALVQPDGRLVLVGDFRSVNGSIRTYIARLVDTTPVTSAEFTSSSATLSETAGTQTITITMPAAISAKYTLPFTVATGTATAGKDYTKLVSPLTFAAGEVSKDIVINLLDDGLVENDETLTITLGTPSDPAVALGAAKVFTLTIQSDDTPPVITVDPSSQIVPVGAPVSFTSAATGTPAPTFQWTKNRSSIRSATATTHNIPSAKLTDAGAYAMKAIGANVTDISANANLTVVDQTDFTFAAPTTGSVVMSVKAASPEVETFQWFKGITPLANDARILGATTSRLTIKGLATADAGDYHCEVTASPGMLSGGTNTLIVYDSAPALTGISPLILTTTMVSENYNFIQPIDPDPLKTPTSFVITGLPRGLTYNRATGQISGRALVSGTFDKIKITPSNLKGKGTTFDAVLQVLPLPPGTSGSYIGLVDKDPVVNAGLGGRLTMSVTSTGALSGRLLAGAESLAFRGVLDTSAAGGDPTAEINLKRSGGRPSFVLNLTLHPGSHLLDGALTITGGLDSAAINGWSNIWSSRGNPVVDFLGYHTFIMDIAPGDDGIEAIPQGCGYASIKVATSGTSTVVGKAGDGSPISFSGLLGPTGQILLQQMLYRNTGSLQGTLGIAANAEQTVGGSLDWHKAMQLNPRERNYKAGFTTLPLLVRGGIYTAPNRTDPAMGLTAGPDNAELLFVEGGISSAPQSPDVVFQISTGATGLMPTFASGNNPDKVTFSVNRSTGAFTGRFTLVNTISLSPLKKITRTVTYSGMIYRDGASQRGCGFFTMAKLPATPADPATTTDILAGACMLIPH